MCDTLVTVTEQGVLFAKNSDRDPNEAQVLRWYAAADHEPGDRVSCTWSSIPQVPHTHAVLLSQPWWMWGAEIGANEHDVVIGNEAVFTRRIRSAATDSPLLGMDMVRLALERASSRHEAVEVIVGLVERHGQGGSCSHEHPRFEYDNSFLVVDTGGAVLVETAGRRWAVEEVVGARSVSNGLTIPGFAKRYADPVRGRVAQCTVRRGLTAAAAERASEPADLMRALRDHGEQGAPRWSPVNGALAAPCAHAGGLLTSTQTTSSWVADLRPDQPRSRPPQLTTRRRADGRQADGRKADGRQADGRHWVTGTSAPCTSLFKPVTVAEPLADVADDSGGPTNRYDPAHLWWRHEELHRLALRDAARSHDLLAAARQSYEERWLVAPPSGPQAFEEAEVAEQQLRDQLSGLDLRDNRPRWVRAQWRRWDAAAGMPSSVRVEQPA